ncbi:conserved hypothetical protein [delta proteobacterium NaphS2]|nr:conserved hypothetical protein [delta proteobacterium NaphS2]
MILLDGTKSVRDLQAIFMRQQGSMLVNAEEILELLKNLDQAYLLDSEAFQSAKGGIISEFTGKRIRPSVHSGGKGDRSGCFPFGNNLPCARVAFLPVLAQKKGHVD